MLITTTKISLAAVLSAIALLGGSAIASARTAVNGNHLPNSVVVVTQSHRDLPVVGGSTGQGPASESDCESAGPRLGRPLLKAAVASRYAWPEIPRGGPSFLGSEPPRWRPIADRGSQASGAPGGL